MVKITPQMMNGYSDFFGSYDVTLRRIFTFGERSESYSVYIGYLDGLFESILVIFATNLQNV